MDAVLRNFKNIPCPAGNRCTQSDCKWKHPRDREAGPAGFDGSSAGDQIGPRKRLKVEPGTEAPSGTKASPDPERPGPGEIATAKKPVSPPPLNRKPPLASHVRTAAATPGSPARPRDQISPTPALAPSSGSSLARPPAPNTAKPPRALKVPAQKAPRRPEALNPRHLKSSPATHEFRLKALKMLHEQFTRLNKELKRDANEEEGKLVLSDQELIWMALDEEERMATDKPPIYSNVIKNRIMAYKRMGVAKWKEERAAARAKAIAATAPAAIDKPLVDPPKDLDTGLTPEQEVEFLSRLLTPVHDLSRYGYVSSVPADEDIRQARAAEEASKGWEVCDRCATRFQVFPGRRDDGVIASGGKCTHHPGKTYLPEKQPGDRSRVPRRWQCCKEAVGDTAGCTKADTHVFKVSDPKRLAAVLPYAETPANPDVPAGRAVCFDCEMGFTVKGLELIRLTATSWPDGAELLDVLVRPVGEILDLNSRYSGVWPEDILSARPFAPSMASNQGPPPPRPQKKQLNVGADDGDDAPHPDHGKKALPIVSSPAVARDLLFSHIAPSTPLIGHGLENDLNATRIVHPSLIDTVLLFPHRRGLPVRHGLRALAASVLGRAIQADDGGRGHDSAEDARAAGDLVRAKVREEWARLRGLGWRVEGAGFVAPGGGEGAGAGSLTEEFLEAAGGAGPASTGDLSRRAGSGVGCRQNGSHS